MSHCLHPTCHKVIESEMSCCLNHWYDLPEEIRKKVWREYRKGQGSDAHTDSLHDCYNFFRRQLVGDGHDEGCDFHPASYLPTRMQSSLNCYCKGVEHVLARESEFSEITLQAKEGEAT